MLHLYVDYNHITQTSSPDDGLALILSMFSIFELAFEKNGRVLRFLYAIMFGEKRYLSNSTRNLVTEKSINIYAEKNASSMSTPSTSCESLETEDR